MRTKAILVLAAFIICLIIVVMIRQSCEGTIKLHHHDFYEQKADWSGYTLENMRFDDRKDLLVSEVLKLPSQLRSGEHHTVYEFYEILLSWNMMVEPGGGVFVELSVSPDSLKWYDFHYQVWGDMNPDTLDLPELPARIENVGYVDEDIIRLKQPMNYYRYALYMYPGEPAGNISFRRAVVCYTKTEASMREYRKFTGDFPDIQPVKLSVPYKSQQWLPDSISGRTCSPTSVTMVLNHHLLDYDHLEVSDELYDRYNDIYGNWLYNVQGAYMLGMKRTWVGRHNSFNELVPEILDGKPVAISIAVRGDQALTGAPYEKTSGHLIVVRGFDEAGNVLVNDPAASNQDDGIVTYDINELTDVWVGHEGVAYHLWPTE